MSCLFLWTNLLQTGMLKRVWISFFCQRSALMLTSPRCRQASANRETHSPTHLRIDPQGSELLNQVHFELLDILRKRIGMFIKTRSVETAQLGELPQSSTQSGMEPKSSKWENPDKIWVGFIHHSNLRKSEARDSIWILPVQQTKAIVKLWSAALVDITWANTFKSSKSFQKKQWQQNMRKIMENLQLSWGIAPLNFHCILHPWESCIYPRCSAWMQVPSTQLQGLTEPNDFGGFIYGIYGSGAIRPWL